MAPEAVVEWYEDSVQTGSGACNASQSRTVTERLWKREPLWTNCVYVGDITDIPGASVAISNCDGLVRLAMALMSGDLPLCTQFLLLLTTCCS